MGGENDIDIYGESEDDKSKIDKNNVNHDGPEDLYDTVLSTGNGTRRGSTESAGRRGTSTVSISGGGGLKHGSGDRRYALYFGNMTWWTTDQDVSDLVSSVGIADLHDVKFHENRTNGQSKGFALVSFGSEASVKIAQEKLPNKEIHGQKLVIMTYSKTSLASLENATKRVEGSNRGEKRDSSSDRRDSRGGTPQKPPQNFMGTIRIGTGPQAAMPPPPGMQTPMMRPPAAQMVTPPPGFAVAGRPVLPPGVMPPGMLPPGLPPNIRLPPPGMGGPPPNMPPPGFPPGAAVRTPPGMTRPPPAIPPPIPGAPAPHINPSFYRPPTSVAPGQPLMQQVAPPPVVPGAIPGIPPHLAPAAPPMEQISEAEFEEIMNRNKTVSSSAISRAVSDASAGDYAAAIETLVTAISLIRQSRVAHDDRCKILIASLQDTLHGIETKSYGRSEKRSRDRSRSRERESRRERKQRRERTSRSRSRSRDRYRQHQADADDYGGPPPRQMRHPRY